MKIAYVIPTLSLGGAEKQQINILNGIDTNKFKVKLFILKNKTQLLPQLKNKNVSVEIFSIDSIFQINELWNFIKSLRNYNPDIIHSQMNNADMLVRFIKLFVLPTSKIIYHIHGFPERMGKAKLYLDKLTSPLVDKIIVVSQKSYDVRLEREGYSKDKMMILHNSANIHASKEYIQGNKGERNFVIGMASRLIPLKNIQAAIYMMSELIKKGFVLNLIVAGNGPEKENLIQYASELGLSKKVDLLGFVTDMESFYDKIDIFCISSTTEDLPLSIVEAMMSGKPILASNVGGIGGIVKDVPCTMLVNNFRDQDEISKIAYFLDTLGMNKCQKDLTDHAINNFGNQSYCSKLEQVYDDLLGNVR